MTDDPTYYWRLFNRECGKVAKLRKINRELRKELIKARREIMRMEEKNNA